MNLLHQRSSARGWASTVSLLLLLGALWPLPVAHGRMAPVTDGPPALRTAEADLRDGTCTPGPSHVDRGDDYLEGLLRAHPEQFAEVLDHAEELRAQILVSEVVRDAAGQPCIRSYGYRLNAEYFYPASAIKTVAAVGSLLTFQAHRDAPELVTTPLSLAARTARLTSGEMVTTSARKGNTTLRAEIERTLVVSNNRGFNVLFDVAGMELMNRAMWRARLKSVRMQHRLEVADLPSDSHRFAPEVRVGRGSARQVVARERTASVAFRNSLQLDMPRTGVGVAHLDSDTRQRIEHPLDFRRKNYISLRDLQRIVLDVVDPTLDGDDTNIPLTAPHRALLRDIMGSRPPAARRVTVEEAEARFKPMTPGISRVIPRADYEYVNKAGRAWGFHLESAYVHHLTTDRAFFVSVVLYVDRDGLMNDNRADYDRLSFPFFVSLGEQLARELLLDP